MTFVPPPESAPQGATRIDYRRIETARANRLRQLEEWREYDSKLSKDEELKRRFQFLKPKRSVSSVRFTDNYILLDAALRNDAEEVKYLLIHQHIDPNLSNVDGLTALHQCCIDNELSICKLLLDHGANVNARDADLWTPLHAAATCGYLQICQLLVRYGADLLALNMDGCIPYDICEDEMTSKYLRDEMERRGISPEEVEEVRLQPEIKMLNDLKAAKSRRMNLNVLDAQGAAPIHVAAACGYHEVGQFLLNSGVNPDSLDADGWTASHVAACWGELEMIRLFVSYGADLTIPTPNGRTVFTICDNEETHDKVTEIWNNREALRANVRSSESGQTSKTLRRRRSTSSIHRSSMRDKSNLSRREVNEEARIARSNPGSLTDTPDLPRSVDDLPNRNNIDDYNDSDDLKPRYPSHRDQPEKRRDSFHSEFKQTTIDRDVVSGRDIFPDEQRDTSGSRNNHGSHDSNLGGHNYLNHVHPTQDDSRSLNVTDRRTRPGITGSIHTRPPTKIPGNDSRDILKNPDKSGKPNIISNSALPRYLDHDNRSTTSTSYDKCCRCCTIL